MKINLHKGHLMLLSENEQDKKYLHDIFYYGRLDGYSEIDDSDKPNWISIWFFENQEEFDTYIKWRKGQLEEDFNIKLPDKPIDQFHQQNGKAK